MGSGTQPVAGAVGRVSIHCSLHGVLPAGAPVLHPLLVTQEWGRGSCSKLSHLEGDKLSPVQQLTRSNQATKRECHPKVTSAAEGTEQALLLNRWSRKDSEVSGNRAES